MKTQQEIQKAHDQLLAIILGDAAEVVVSSTDRRGLCAAADALCWVLEHDHNRGFENNLRMIDEEMTRLGYVLTPRPHETEKTPDINPE